MVFCTNCGAKISEESKFCRECGSEIKIPAKGIEVSSTEVDSIPDIVVADTEEAPPKLYVKSKLFASLCAIGLFPFLMNMHMVFAACLLVSGIIGLLTHRAKDIGWRKGFYGIVGIISGVGGLIGVWGVDSVFEIVFMVVIVFLFDLPFYRGSRM